MRFTLLAVAAVVVASSCQFPGVTWVNADATATAAPPSVAGPHAPTTAAAVPPALSL